MNLQKLMRPQKHKDGLKKNKKTATSKDLETVTFPF